MTPDLAHRKLAVLLASAGQSLGSDEVAAALLEGFGVAAPALAEIEAAARLAFADRPELPGVAAAGQAMLTHPLCQAPALPVGPSPPGDGAARLAGQAARALVAACGADPARRFLAAWRWLADGLATAEGIGGPVGARWQWLPADPRLPDPALLDQASLISALAGAGERPAFLVFAIGPVQGFITQARTTRDLWAGSFLVSWLSWQAIRAVAEALGPDALLYPSLRGQPLVDDWLAALQVPRANDAVVPPHRARRVVGFPNKLLAVVPADEARAVAEAAVRAVRAGWRELSAQADAWVGAQALPAWRPQGWQEQAERQWETSWVALPWPPDGAAGEWQQVAERLLGPGHGAGPAREPAEGHYRPGPGRHYAAAHALAQRAFDARKLTRPFRASAGPGFKCTLCGQRAPALGADLGYAEQRSVWAGLAAALGRPDLLPAGGDERLCAVCLTKRVAFETATLRAALAQDRPEFPSVSSMATWPFRRALVHTLRDLPGLARPVEALTRALGELERHRSELGTVVVPGGGLFDELLPAPHEVPPEAYMAAGGLLRLDGEWLLDETYERRLGEVAARNGARAALERARGALRELLTAAQEVGVRQPSPYYAILVMDGDRMGRWVSGEQHRATLADLLQPDVRAALERQGGWQATLKSRRLFGPSAHASLGAILRDFALWVAPACVRGAEGQLVYAGGDDVLALLPADQALGALEALRRSYMAPFLAARDGRLLGPPPGAPPADAVVFRGMSRDATVSAGLLFTHHLYPLRLALEAARGLEHAAKVAGGRNAVGIGVARRSGPDPELELVSKHERGGRPLAALIEEARGLFRANQAERERTEAARRVPYELGQLAAVLDQLGDAQATQAVVAAVARRHSRAQDIAERLLNIANALAAPGPAGEGDGASQTGRSTTGELSRLLRLARFLEAET